MKKVFVVSKTHLDLGFTDYASVIRQTYLDSYIPAAVSLAKQVNTAEKKRFIWTTGSWILKEALEHGNEEQRNALCAAIQRGDIVPHAMPFTVHTELLDEDTLDYGLSLVEKLDALRGRKTVAAKMTDVPGHTRGLVELLSRHGIKLLHIGVNGASAMPEVPDCFLWKSGAHEVVVIYSGDYGGAFQCELAEEILYFDHTLDNRGTPPVSKILKKFNAIQKQYPEYEVCAGCMDDFGEILWKQRHRLPVVTGEIGDTWIHGSASDPYKSAALRELMRLKRRWLGAGTMKKDSLEYTGFTDALLCIAEHTCGMDTKKYFSDYEHYLKKDFQAARKADQVKIHHPLRGFPQNLLALWNRKTGEYAPGSYRTIEKSWQEQRDYIQSALASLSREHGEEAQRALDWLRPKQPMKMEGKGNPYALLRCAGWEFQMNLYGGVGRLAFHGDPVLRDNSSPPAEYRSYGDEDYAFWLAHYTRNLKQTFSWAVGDFARPLLKYVSGKYPSGRFPYQVKYASVTETSDGEPMVCADFTCDSALSKQLGAPRQMQIVYRLSGTGLTMDVSWFGKDANRLTEAVFLHLFPAKGTFTLRKIKDSVSPDSVVSRGSRNLHAAMAAQLDTGRGQYALTSCHAPVVSIGKGKILEFDNRLEDVDKEGMTYVLYNNVWGTNFPLWYEENARFRFQITRCGEEDKDE